MVFPGKETSGEEESMHCCEIFSGFRNRSAWVQDAVIAGRFANISEGLDVDPTIRSVRENDTQSLDHVLTDSVGTGVREDEARDIVAPGSQSAIGTLLEKGGHFERLRWHGVNSSC